MLGDAAPAGGIIETIAGEQRPMVLNIGGIERLERRYRSVYDLWDGFLNNGTKPTSTEVRDIVCLGLVGGGMAEPEADEIMAKTGPDELHKMYEIALAILGVAFFPDVAEANKKKAADRTDLTPDE